MLHVPAVSIVGEIELPICQALLAKEGTTLVDINVVYSHVQGIARGTVWSCGERQNCIENATFHTFGTSKNYTDRKLGVTQ